MIGLDLKQGTHVGQGRESTLEYAIKIAATLVDRTLTRSAGVWLVTQAGSVQIDVRAHDQEAARYRLFEHLARAEATFELEWPLEGGQAFDRQNHGFHLGVGGRCGDRRNDMLRLAADRFGVAPRL